MVIEKIIKKNKEYLLEKEKVDLLYHDLCGLCSEVSVSDLEKLDYSMLKEVIELLNFKVSDTKRAELNAYYQSRREKEHPTINDVNYYPDLNKLDNLSKEDKYKLDMYLSKNRVGNYLYTGSSLYIKSGLSKFMTSSIWEELFKLGIVEKVYKYSVDCDCDSFDKSDEFITDEEYQKLKRYYTVDRTTLSEDELEELEDSYTYLSYSCERCDTYEEIDNLTKLENFEILYKLKLPADRSVDKL